MESPQEKQESQRTFWEKHKHLIGTNLIQTIKEVYGEDIVSDDARFTKIIKEINLYLQYSIDIMEATHRTTEILEKIKKVLKIRSKLKALIYYGNNSSITDRTGSEIQKTLNN